MSETSRTGAVLRPVKSGPHEGLWASLEKHDATAHYPFLEGRTWEHHPSQAGVVIEYSSGPTDAPVVGANQSTVVRDLASSDAGASDAPRTVKSIDGVERPPDPNEVWAEKRAEALAKAKGGKLQYLKVLNYYPGDELPEDKELFLRRIADHANSRFPYRSAFMGHAWLARAAEISERTVRRRVAWLKANGFLIEMSKGSTRGGENRAAEYCLSLPEWSHEEATGSQPPDTQDVR